MSSFTESAYLKTITQRPCLSSVDIHSLVLDMKAGDIYAREELIRYYLKEVIRIANYFKIKINLPFEDLVTIGTIGLIKAIDKYDPNRGEIDKYVIGGIRLAFKRYISHLSQHNSGPDFSTVLSLEASPFGEESSDTLLREMINSPDDTEYLATSNVLRSEIIIIMSELLTEREFEVLSLRYGFLAGDCLTLQAIGDILGITRQSVQYFEKRALGKLRNYSEIDRYYNCS